MNAGTADVIFRLGLADQMDLAAGSWVSETELFQWADEAVKHLAYSAGVFIQYDASVSVSADTAVYALSPDHVTTVQAAIVDASGVSILRLTPVRDLWALDAHWPMVSGRPQRVSLDAGSVGTATLYPMPVESGTFAQLAQWLPPQVTAVSPAVALPTVFQDMLGYAMLAGGRGKESDACQPEMAAHFRERVAMYEAIAKGLYGPPA